MRVTHIVPALFGPDGIVGGAERYALELARHMADAGVQTRLIAFGAQAREERVDRLRIHVIDRAWYVRGQQSNPFAWRLFGLLRGADVVHCHQQHVLASSLVAAWCRVTGRRVFVSDLGGGGWDVSAYISTDGWYDGHLHISEYSRQIHRHTGRRNARVIFGGVNTDRFSPGAGLPRSRNALFVGRLLPHKGVEDLLDAVSPDMALTLVGPRPSADRLAHLQARAQGKAVRFEHDLDDASLVDRYRRAACVILPSVYRTADGSETQVPELLGQTLLEGMACETPAICTQVASMPEVVEDGVTGFVVPPNDPAALRDRIAWLIAHPHEAQAMGRAGRARVLDRFTWPRVVTRCLEAYESSATPR